MQKTVYTCFRVTDEIFKKRCAFVAFVATARKSANAWSDGVILKETMATIIYFKLNQLLPLLPVEVKTGSRGNKISGGGNKVKNHCCRTFAKNNAIAGNEGRKQQRQQRHTFFELLWGGVSFPENRAGGELVEMGVIL